MFNFVAAKNDRGADITNRWDALSEENDEDLSETAQPLPRLSPPSLYNLAISRPAPPILSAEKEATLILAAQAGDAKAARQLLLSHLPWVRTIARKIWGGLNPPDQINPEHAFTFDDFVAAGLAAWWGPSCGGSLAAMGLMLSREKPFAEPFPT